MPQILGFGAAFSIIMSAFEYTGGTLRGRPRGEVPEMDEYDRKEYLRKNRRRPITETIAEIGEGRGTNPIFLIILRQRMNKTLTEVM